MYLKTRDAARWDLDPVPMYLTNWIDLLSALTTWPGVNVVTVLSHAPLHLAAPTRLQRAGRPGRLMPDTWPTYGVSVLPISPPVPTLGQHG